MFGDARLCSAKRVLRTKIRGKKKKGECEKERAALVVRGNAASPKAWIMAADLRGMTREREWDESRIFEGARAGQCLGRDTTTCIPGDRLCSALREQIGEHRAGTRARRRGELKGGRGKHQLKRRRRRRRRSRSRSKRGWKHCSRPTPAPFSAGPARFFFFFLFPHISYRCTMRYVLPS